MRLAARGWRLATGSLVLAMTQVAAIRAGEPAETGKLRAFRAARIVPVEGPDVAPGVLLIRGEKVEKVLAAGDPLPADAEVTDLGAAIVLPALVNPMTGIVSGDRFLDGRRGAVSSPISGPGDGRRQKAAEALDPKAPALRRLARTGYGSVGIVPSGPGLLGGISAVARTRTAAEREEVILKDAAYLSMSYALGSPMREMAERELGKAAEAWKKMREEREKAAKEKSGGPPPGERPAEPDPAKEKAAGKDAPAPEPKPERRQPQEAEKAAAEKAPEAPKPAEKPAEKPKPPEPPDPLVQVFSGELPAFIRVDSAAALAHLFRVLDKVPEPFPFVLVAPALEPEIVIEAARRKPSIRGVVLEPVLDAFADTSVLYNPARLFDAAGIEVAVVPAADDVTGHGDVLFHLAELVKAGLPARAALRSVTAAPAKLLGIDDRAGSLLPGRDASFAAFDGDPLSGCARIAAVWIQGEEVYRDDPATGKTSGEALR